MAGFTADGRVAVGPVPALSDDGVPGVGLWDVATRQLIRRFELDDYGVGAISPDGSVLFTYQDVVGGPNGTFWNAADGTKLRSIEQPGGMINATFSPDGTTVLAVGRDDVARLWDVRTGTLLHELHGHTNIMWRGAWSPDGHYVFTTSQDKSARMWDARTGLQLRYFAGHALSAVAGIAVSPDGSQIAIGSYDGAVQLTPTGSDDLIGSVCARLRRDLTDIERSIYDITDQRATCPGS